MSLMKLDLCFMTLQEPKMLILLDLILWNNIYLWKYFPNMRLPKMLLSIMLTTKQNFNLPWISTMRNKAKDLFVGGLSTILFEKLQKSKNRIKNFRLKNLDQLHNSPILTHDAYQKTEAGVDSFRKFASVNKFDSRFLARMTLGCKFRK